MNPLFLSMFVALLVIVQVSPKAAPVEGTGLAGEHWKKPLPHQGPAPAHWDKIAISLEPESCGACHADKLDEWRETLHSKSFSGALLGIATVMQFRDLETCMSCHAPLAEQVDDFIAGRDDRSGDLPLKSRIGLAASGNGCASCHMRNRRIFAPPDSINGETGLGDPASPHGAVARVSWFEDAKFCAGCHQHPPDPDLEGLAPLVNTYEEWKQSPQAKEGKTCQSCHMPERKHLWRGIHDPEMTASGLTVTTETIDGELFFKLSNTGVGHYFPTYAVPRVVMYVVALDDHNNPVENTMVSYEIMRRVKYFNGTLRQLDDTRLKPGDSASISIFWENYSKARVWVEVQPKYDYAIRGFNAWLQVIPQASEGRALVEAGLKKAQSLKYRILEKTVLRRP